MYIGIDVGGTNLKAGLVDQSGTILAVERTPLDFRGPESFADTLASLAKAVMASGGAAAQDVEYVGIGIPGAVAGGDILYTANIPMKNVPLEKLFRQHLDLPVLLGNDADCAAVGEWSCGVGRGTKHFIVITLGTGVGGGIVVEGNLLHGAHGSGAEIGHLVLNRNETVPCNCGKYGCVEQYCSATGIVRVAKRHLEATDAPSTLRGLEAMTCKDIFDAGKAGDKEALAILEQVYDCMGQFLANVCSTVDPEVVVIGGGVSKAGQMLLDGIVPYFRKYVFHAASGARFALASLGNDAGAYGAFKLALDAFGG